jgi:hypothetical protein
MAPIDITLGVTLFVLCALFVGTLWRDNRKWKRTKKEFGYGNGCSNRRVLLPRVLTRNR